MRNLTRLSMIGLLLLAACGREPATETRSAERGAAAPDVRDVSAPVAPTEYVTSLVFLPLETAPTRGLVLDFSSSATSDSLRHRYLAWQLTSRGWRSLLDIDSTTTPIREPWRIFPLRPLRLTVSAEGDVDAIILPVSSGVGTLDLGEHIDRWEDRARTRHAIREAVWIRGGRSVSGIAVAHRFAVPEPGAPARFGSYQRVLLRSADGAVLALFQTDSVEAYGDPYAWMYLEGLTRRWTEVEVRVVEVAHSDPLRRNVPIRILFQIPEPDIKGELTAAERRFDELDVSRGPKPYSALYRVRGWIEFAGERRNVEGVLERGEP